MQSSRLIIYSARLNRQCSREQNTNFRQKYSDQEKKEITKEWNKCDINIKNPKLFGNTTKKSKIIINKNTLSDEEKLIHIYKNVRNKELSNYVSDQVERQLAFSNDVNSTNSYQPECTLKLSFATKIPKETESERRFDIHFHYLVKKNNQILGLNQNGELEVFNQQQIENIQNAIAEIERNLADDNAFHTLKEKITRETLESCKQINNSLKLNYSPVSFACCTRIITVTNEHTKLPHQYFPPDKYEKIGKTVIFKNSRDISQIDNPGQFSDNHCVYYKQTDFILGTHTDDVIIRPELIAKNNESLRSNNELQDRAYRLHNVGLLKNTSPTSQSSCGIYEWLMEIMEYIGSLIQDMLALFNNESQFKPPRFDF